jgi:hypothetical protein
MAEASTTTNTTEAATAKSPYANSALVSYPADQIIELGVHLFMNAANLSELCRSAYKDKGRGFLSVLMIQQEPYFVMQYMTPDADEDDENLRTMVAQYNPDKCYLVRMAVQPAAGETSFFMRFFPVPLIPCAPPPPQ